MKAVVVCGIFLLSLTAGPLRAQARYPSSATERELPAPRADAELRGLARQQAALLADLLRLSQPQALHLQKALYDRFWQTQVLEETPPAGRPMPAASATDVSRAYYYRLSRVLSPDQYAALLRLESPAIAPFAPLAQATRYVPADRLLAHHWPAHRPQTTAAGN